MKKRPFTLYISILLILSSVILYSLHYLFFRDVHFLEIYILDHLAFVPIEILLVTIIIGSLLEYRDKTNRLEKMDMVIGTFYSEVGRELLLLLSTADPALGAKQDLLRQVEKWSRRDFADCRKRIQVLDNRVTCTASILPQLKANLVSRRDFLLRLMENPNLLEHDKFTSLMQEVFHLLEELQFRPGFDNLPAADYAHLSLDAARVYAPLLLQWIDHLANLKQFYPYLFSLAARTNPFDPEMEVSIKDK